MLAHTAGIILVLCLWNVFDSAQGQTCTFNGQCSQLARVQYSCGVFGTCFHYFLVYYDCQRTEACTDSFGLWSTCTASCAPGGTRSRTRTCTVVTGQSCVSTDTEACNVETPCARENVDGNWAEWGQWTTTTCSVTCCTGVGPQTRSRTCSNPPPSGTGATCPGPSEENRSGIFPCGGPEVQCPVVCTDNNQRFADTCQQCVNNFYECDAGLNAVVQNCATGLVWSQGLQACTSPVLCVLNP